MNSLPIHLPFSTFTSSPVWRMLGTQAGLTPPNQCCEKCNRYHRIGLDHTEFRSKPRVTTRNTGCINTYLSIFLCFVHVFCQCGNRADERARDRKLRIELFDFVIVLS